MKRHSRHSARFAETAAAYLARRKRVSPKNKMPPAPLAPDAALDLFYAMANLKDMGWGFIRTSCYPKAYLMCEMALNMGLSPQKAWAFESERPLSGEHPSGGEFNWMYHVALALPVKMPDGRVENLIFDPTLFDAPVSLREWGGSMGAASEKLCITPYNEGPDPSLCGQMKNVVTHTPEITQLALKRIEAWGIMTEPGPRMVFESETLRGAIDEKLPRMREGWTVVAKSAGNDDYSSGLSRSVNPAVYAAAAPAP